MPSLVHSEPSHGQCNARMIIPFGRNADSPLMTASKHLRHQAIEPDLLHNNSDCGVKAAASARDEADNATARTTVPIEKLNIAEISE